MTPTRRWEQNPYFVLALLFGLNLMNFFDRAILSAVTEPVRREWGLRDTEIGWLGTAFTLVYAIAGLPLGRLADRSSRKWLLAIGIAAWSLLTAASGFSTGFWSLFAARIGVGIGEASCAPAANSLIGDLFGPRQRGRAISMFMLGLPVGLCLSYLITGPVAHHYGWRTPFYLASMPGLLLAVLILTVREPQRGAQEAESPVPTAPVLGYRASLKALLGMPAMWWIIGSGVFYNFNFYALGSFLTALMMRRYGLDLQAANGVSAIVLGAMTAVGMLAGGWAADRAHRWRGEGRLLLAGTALLGTALFMFLGLGRPAGATTAFIALIGMGMMFYSFYYGPVYATIQDLVEPQRRGTAMALYFFGMYVLGASFGPLGTGVLSDHFARRAMQAAGAAVLSEGHRATGLHNAMYVVPVLALLAAGTLFAAARAVSRRCNS
jgi:MFS family permease